MPPKASSCGVNLSLSFQLPANKKRLLGLVAPALKAKVELEISGVRTSLGDTVAVSEASFHSCCACSTTATLFWPENN